MWFLYWITAALAADRTTQVESLFRNAENWDPAAFTQAMGKVRSWGRDAVPPLIVIAERETGSNTRYSVCAALAEIPDARSLPTLSALTHAPEWVVRSQCGESYARLAAVLPEADLSPVVLLLGRDPECIVRVNVARAIGPRSHAGLRTQFSAWIGSTDVCESRVGMSGLAFDPAATSGDGPAKILGVLRDTRRSVDERETAADAFIHIPYPPALPTLRELVSGRLDNRANLRWMAAEALGGLGTDEDIPLLRAMIAEDPYNGDGVLAIKGKAAIKKIQAR